MVANQFRITQVSPVAVIGTISVTPHSDVGTKLAAPTLKAFGATGSTRATDCCGRLAAALLPRDQINVTNHAGVMRLSVTTAFCDFFPQIR